MPSVAVDPAKVHEFPDLDSFSQWLSQHHSTETEVWIKMHKVSSGLKCITTRESIDAALCWGWIDAIRKSLNDSSYLQRFTPRGKKSIWSQVNVDNVARLIQEKRMTPHGLKHVEAAQADGRWDRAYASGKKLEIPADLQAAIDAEPKAKAMIIKLTEQNRYALAFRMHNTRTPAARQRKIATYVAMLKAGETIYPQKA